MNEERKRGRKPNTPNLDTVVSAIERGEYDQRWSFLESAVRQRNKQRRQAVMEKVKEVFGPDAEVHTKQEVQVPREELEKIFKKSPRSSPRQEPVEKSDSEEGEEEKSDPTQDLDEVEKRMAQEGGAPIEKRGAIISGLHSSEIAD